MLNENSMMTLPQVARYLGLSPRTVYLWAQQEKIPGFKLGSAWRFRVSEIDQWMETQRTGPSVRPRSRLTDASEPIVSKHRLELDEKRAEEAMVEDCAGNILEKLEDDTRDVWTTDDVEEVFGQVIVERALNQLRKAKKISIGEEKGLEGRKVRVIRRRN